jgi:hypothetical protein
MMEPLDVDNALVLAIKVGLPYLKTVEQHGPEFSESDLRNYTITAPFCLVIANDEEVAVYGQGGQSIVTKEPHTIFAGAKTMLSMESAIIGIKQIVKDLKSLLDGKVILAEGSTVGPFKYEGLKYEYTGVGLVTLSMNFILHTI